MNKIFLLREKLHMTQDEFAEYCGIAKISITRYEGGANLSRANAIKIAKACDVSIDYLMGTETQKEDVPKTREARIVSGLMDKLPLENREQIVNVVYAMCKNRPELFEGENENDA